jgi:hypothetical protein
VKRSTRLGIASAILLLCIFIPPYRAWRTPINASLAVLSCVLAAVAGGTGRRLWLVIPASIFAAFALDLCLLIYAF